MSTGIEVPVLVVERARMHLAKTGTPLLLRDRRRRNDWPLVALPSNLGYLLLLHPETPPAQMYFAMAERNPERDVLADIAKLAATALEDVPRRFVCGGQVVGLWEIVPTEAAQTVCVRGPVALTLLSWFLRARKVGFYVTLSEVPAVGDD
jgi:hypothetical protein